MGHVACESGALTSIHLYLTHQRSATDTISFKKQPKS